MFSVEQNRGIWQLILDLSIHIHNLTRLRHFTLNKKVSIAIHIPTTLTYESRIIIQSDIYTLITGMTV